jgi:hypothetical protein
MNSIYVVIENGECYPMAYTTYLSAVKAVKQKHKEYIESQIKDNMNLLIKKVYHFM